MRKILSTTLFSVLVLSAFAQNQTKKILGVWWNEEKSSRIEIFEKNNKVYGKIVWLHKNSNPDGTTPRRDFNNPEEDLQKRPLIGVIILKDLVWDDGDTEWDDGEIYDPASGNTYSCYAKLQKDGKLYLKGYIMGMTFMGRSTLWSRYN